MPRITILAVGNGDVRDSLCALHENGQVTWNGINPVLRDRRPGWTARVVHRTLARSDILLAADGGVPQPLVGRRCPPEPFSAESQYAPDVFGVAADALVLSIQPDVMNAVCRHREDGHLLYPHDLDRWAPEQRDWLRSCYEPMPPLEPEASMAQLARIAARFKETSRAPILVFNMSATMPWERIRRYRGLEETLGERIARFNLALKVLARQIDIAIVDVDAVLARAGVTGTKLDAVSLTARGCELVAAEVVATLEEVGLFDAERQP